jgi:flagellar biogenesis protein FliO
MDPVRPVLSVVAVLALVFAAAWWIRRSAGVSGAGLLRISKASRSMSVIERLPLTPQHALLLVSHGREKLLIAVHPAGVNVIDRFKSEQAPLIPGDDGGAR